MYGGSTPGGSARPPARKPRSVGFTVAAATLTRTCPGPGEGLGTVTMRSTDGSPNSVKPTARIISGMMFLLSRVLPGPRRVPGTSRYPVYRALTRAAERAFPARSVRRG